MTHNPASNLSKTILEERYKSKLPWSQSGYYKVLPCKQGIFHVQVFHFTLSA